jgi:hypothetical protein
VRVVGTGFIRHGLSACYSGQQAAAGVRLLRLGMAVAAAASTGSFGWLARWSSVGA